MKFEDSKIREVEHCVHFTGHAEQHVANACIEMPASVFISAVKTAWRIPFGQGPAFFDNGVGKRGYCETYDAIQLLCVWWNQHAPRQETRCAGFFEPWVCVLDDGEYRAGYNETPNAPIGVFGTDTLAHARVANLVMIEFVKGSEHFMYFDYGVDIYSVTGAQSINIDPVTEAQTNSIGVGREEVESGEFDLAWYTLKAMYDFPNRFSAAWDELSRLAASRDHG